MFLSWATTLDNTKFGRRLQRGVFKKSWTQLANTISIQPRFQALSEVGRLCRCMPQVPVELGFVRVAQTCIQGVG